MRKYIKNLSLLLSISLQLSLLAVQSSPAHAASAQIITIQHAALEAITWHTGLQIKCDNTLYDKVSQLHSTIALQIAWRIAARGAGYQAYDLRWRLRANDGSYQTEQRKKKLLHPSPSNVINEPQNSVQLSFTGTYRITMLATSHCLASSVQSLHAGDYLLDLWIHDTNDTSDNIIWHQQFPLVLDILGK